MRARTIYAVAFIVAVAACGSGSRLSKAQLDAKANVICKRYRAEIGEVPTPKRIEDVPAYVTRIKPSIERGVDALADLKPPRDLQRTYHEWLATQRDALRQTDALRRAAQRNDLLGANRTIRQLRERNRRGNALAARLGASACAGQ